MSQEKRILLASALSVIVLVLYSRFFVPQRSAIQPQDPPDEKKIQQQDPITQLKPEEEVITLESDKLVIKIGKSSTAVRSISLKEFKNNSSGSSIEFGTTFPVFHVLVDQDHVSWALSAQSQRRVVWRTTREDVTMLELSLELSEITPTFVVSLNVKNSSGELKKLPVQIVSAWARSDNSSGQYNVLEAIFLTQKEQQWQRTHLRYREGASQPRRVPRGTPLVTLSERYFCQSIQLDRKQKARVSLIPAQKGVIAASIESTVGVEPQEEASYSVSVYTGPRDFFNLRDAGFAHAFPLGLLSRIGLVLVLLLKWIAAVTRSYGIAIIVLAGLVTLVLSPFTLISFRSMKKLQELQPKIEQIKKKHEKDQVKANQETFALFKEHRVSPLSGCLPMFIQLPVFFALWSSISQLIELRGERFLWIKDLSLPDRFAKLPVGVELNLLPVLMAAAMYIQTRMSQKNVPKTGKNIFSGPMMSVLFGVMFYQVPSSVVLYWLTNSLISIFVYRLARL